MISVRVEQAQGVRSLHIDGHADYNPGNDIVCAGCSAIVYALMGYVANMPQHIRNVDELYYKSGNAQIVVDGDDSFAAAFEMAVIGLMQIAKKYPRNVHVEIG